MSASEVLSQVRLPNELNYGELPSSLPSAKNQLVVCQPINGAVFTSAGQNIQIDVPCQRNNYMLNPHFRFRQRYTVGGTPATDTFVKLGIAAYSPFTTQSIYANNQTLIEQISHVNELANYVFRSTLTSAEIAGMAGFLNTNGTSGNVAHTFHNAATNIDYLDFDQGAPMLGILNSDKMFPLGKLNSLRIEFVLDDVLNYIQDTNATQAVTTEIFDFEFIFNSVMLQDEAQMIIDSMLQNEKLMLRTRSWRHSSGTPLSAGAGVGSYQIQCGIRCSSMVAILFACHPANSRDKGYGSVCPNLGANTSFLINGQQVPQRGVDPINHPSEVGAMQQAFWNGLSSAAHSGSFSKSAFMRSSTDAGLLKAYSSTANTSPSVAPNQWYFAVDTEIVSKKADVLLAGITVDTPIFFNANIAVPLANVVHYIDFFASLDCILEFDLATKSCIARY